MNLQSLIAAAAYSYAPDRDSTEVYPGAKN